MTWSVVGVLLVVASGVLLTIKYLRRAASTEAALGERDAALDVEARRRRDMEAAQAEARRERRKRLNAKAADADSDAADRLLRELTGADDPNVN